MSLKLNQVVESDLCIACGACIESCPKDNIKPHYSEIRGAHEIKISDIDICGPCEKPCENVCPSIKVDFFDASKRIDATVDYSPSVAEKSSYDLDKNARIGPIEKVYVGYSSMYQNDGVSSSGGIIRQLLDYTLTNDVSVICLAGENGSYLPEVLTSKNDLKRMPGSIYHGVSFTGAIKLLREVQGQAVIVAIPCQFEGILQYIRKMEPELEKKIFLKVGIICGWMYTDHSYKMFSSFSGIKGNISSVSYRGEDEVGKLKIVANDKEHKFDRRKWKTFKSWFIYSASYSRDMNRLRCRTCQNHTNILADISVGDAWLARKTSEKVSIVVTRTSQGQKMIEKMLNLSVINLELGGIDDIEESQSEDLVYGTSARKYIDSMKANQQFYPEFIFDSQLVNETVEENKKTTLKSEFFRRKVLRSGLYKFYSFLYLLSKREMLKKRVLARFNK